ncbi:MAG: V-type ATP synthase subunit E [Bacteroidota bacterium]|nr:MAG: V-type ATP synthase subunit E [Bacteroidota bacterium]
MQSKLQELTEKIYQEGLAKGNEEGRALVDKAKKEASEIIANAKKEAGTILAEAQKQAAETKKNTESEIKLSARQALNALKQQITDAVNSKVIASATGKAFDAEFAKQLIESTLKNWAGSQVADLNLVIPKAQEKELTEHLKKSVKDLFEKGLTISNDASVKAGFQITAKDGSYKISFTDEDFNNFFRQYLRPKLIQFLYEA